MRIFGPQTAFARLMNKNLEDGEAITHPWLSKAIETAQKKVEARNYDIRKQVVEYDDVMNDQRKVIYAQREEVMDADHVSDVVEDMRADTASGLVIHYCPPGSFPEQWDIAGLKEGVADIFELDIPAEKWAEEEEVDQELWIDRINEAADAKMAEKTKDLDEERWKMIEKSVLLQSIDSNWKEHLSTLDALRQSIGLRSYAQRKPIDEYKQEAFMLFERLLVTIREEVTKALTRLQIQIEQPAPPPPGELPDFITSHFDPLSGDDNSADVDAATGNVRSSLPPRQSPRPDAPQAVLDAAPEGEFTAPGNRNAPCPCGSGRKYKHCHGSLA